MIKSGTLDATPHLSVLNVENNRITSFPRTIFSEDHHPTNLELWMSGKPLFINFGLRTLPEWKYYKKTTLYQKDVSFPENNYLKMALFSGKVNLLIP